MCMCMEQQSEYCLFIILNFFQSGYLRNRQMKLKMYFNQLVKWEQLHSQFSAIKKIIEEVVDSIINNLIIVKKLYRMEEKKNISQKEEKSQRKENVKYYKLPHEYPDWEEVKIRLIKIAKNQEMNIHTIFEIINEYTKGLDLKWSNKNYQNSSFAKILENVLINAARFALDVQNLFPEGIQISTPQNANVYRKYTVLTKKQCCCLVANMVMCTVKKQEEFKNIPIFFNFYRLFRSPNQIIKTIDNYFSRILDYEEKNPAILENKVVFFRIGKTLTFQDWIESEEPLCEIQFSKVGSIEDAKQDIQIDFANKSIGGFFLSHTFTQEDIIFINSPELMPALLFHLYMQQNQCILMVGAQRFSTYTGYLESYKFQNNFVDDRPYIDLELDKTKKVRVKDSWISAIDAIPYFIKSEFNDSNMLRELNKAYVGFEIDKIDGMNKKVSTGNWGSGAFCGTLAYKFLLQWIAASKAKRSIKYYTFGNNQADDIPAVINKLKKMNVAELTNLLVKSQKIFTRKNIFSVFLYE